MKKKTQIAPLRELESSSLREAICLLLFHVEFVPPLAAEWRIKMKLTSIITVSCLLLSLTLTSCGQKETKSALTDGVPNQTESASNTEKQTEAPEDASEAVPVPTSEATKEPEKVTPTCMFFSSKNDTDHDKIMDDIEELKEKYDGKIKFDLIDVDENPEAKENYSIGDQTPALIMLNIYNDISAFQYNVKNKEQIENAIKGGLGE